jgi:hypothetical protein
VADRTDQRRAGGCCRSVGLSSSGHDGLEELVDQHGNAVSAD